MAEAFGFEGGGVLYEQLPAIDVRAFFGNNYLETPEVPGAFDALHALAARFVDRRYGVITCGPETEGRVRAWLASRDFARRTGIPDGNIRFCRKDTQKVALCRELKVSSMVDDSFPDLLRLRSVRFRFLFRGKLHEIRRHALSLKRVIRVSEWSEVLDRLS